MKAFLLQLASFSLTRKSWINSGASGMRCSKFLKQINTISVLFTIGDQEKCNHKDNWTVCTYRWYKLPGQHCDARNCDGAPSRPGLRAWEAQATLTPSACTGNAEWIHGWTHLDAAGPEIWGKNEWFITMMKLKGNPINQSQVTLSIVIMLLYYTWNYNNIQFIDQKVVKAYYKLC